MKTTAISPTRSENYAEWYQQVIRAADLAESSPVRGCMVIKPWGYAIWELMQRELDGQFKRTGHKNAYFPLFVPLSYLQREANHVEGFAKECAVVTHSRLVQNREGKLEPASPLEEPLIVRPTSETIIGESFSRWVHSYRDLPLLINQWANVVRWEMRPRLFLRTAEFLWQEGHTVHDTHDGAMAEVLQMLEIYRHFAEEFLAIPVLAGKKSPMERFPGAVETFSIEAMVQDGKALQAGTSHFLGQNFSRACRIQFTDRDGEEKFAWTTSWGVSTRLIGGLVMAHSDDNGLVLPPRVAPIQIVLLPVIHRELDRGTILEWAKNLANQLEKKLFRGQPLRVEIDDRELRGGEKMWEQVKRGVPISVEMGPRDWDARQIVFTCRSDGEKRRIPEETFLERVTDILEEIQDALLARALQFRKDHTSHLTSLEEFGEFFARGNGFAHTYFSGDDAMESQIRETWGVTARCMPLDEENQCGPCFIHPNRNGKPMIWARSY
jgi:prolyl-tRNA synthetase